MLWMGSSTLRWLQTDKFVGTILAFSLQAIEMLNLQRSVTVIHTSSSCAHCVSAVWFMSTRLVFHSPETELLLRFQQSHHEIRRKIGLNEATGGGLRHLMGF